MRFFEAVSKLIMNLSWRGCEKRCCFVASTAMNTWTSMKSDVQVNAAFPLG